MIDFDKMLADADPALKQEVAEEIDQDEHAKLFSRLAPKLWYVMLKEVPNSSPSTLVTATLYATAYLAALPQKDIEDIEAYKKAVLGSFSSALDDAFEKDDLPIRVPQLASVGQLNLYRELNNENTAVLQQVATLLERLK